MNSLHYNILQPKKKVENPPLLVMLHGYGSDENDLFSFAEMLNDRFLVVSLRAPKRLPWGGYAWYDIDFTSSASRFGNPEQALDSLAQVNKQIDAIIAEHKTDGAKTVLLGFSQGAILSYALSARFPHKFDGVLALSGYIFNEIMPSALSAEDLSHFEVFATHGIQDEVIPIAWARNAEKWLESQGAKYEFREYPGMGHGINPDCFKDMLAWIHKRYPEL